MWSKNKKSITIKYDHNEEKSINTKKGGSNSSEGEDGWTSLSMLFDFRNFYDCSGELVSDVFRAVLESK